VTRWIIVFPLLLITLAALLCGLANRFAGVDAEDRRAVRAFEQRLRSRRASDPWVSKDGTFTVAVEREPGRVVRRDAAGKTQWSIPIDEGVVREVLPVEEVAGLFLVQRHDDTDGAGDAYLIDREGQVRHRFSCQVVAGVRVGDDRVFVTSHDVRRVTADDRTVWSVPFSYREWIAGGDILKAPDGDLVAFLYDHISDSGVQVIRINPDSGVPRWRVSCRPLGVDHSKYSHAADVELINDRMRVISRGSFGTFVEWLDGRTGASLRRTQRREW
jgi:hypothetical protein